MSNSGTMQDPAVTDPSLAATITSILKGLLTRLAGGFPAALGAGGGLKVDGSGTALPVSLAASELHLGQVGGYADILDVTPVLSVDAYGAGEVLFVATEVPNAVRTNGGKAIVTSVQVLDVSEQAPAFDLYFWRSTQDVGTINDAVAISDAEALEFLGMVRFATTDYVDIGGQKWAILKPKDSGFLIDQIEGGAGSKSIYISGVNGAGTPDFVAASDMSFKIGVVQA